jgi:hypothetical protein
MQRTWPSMLARGAMLLAIAALSVLNGAAFNPVFDSVGYILYLFSRGSRFVAADMLFHLTTALIAAATFLVAGIPAAIYERVRGLPRSSFGSLSIWLLATALLTLPTVLRLFADE